MKCVKESAGETGANAAIEVSRRFDIDNKERKSMDGL
jgi:hypothetical protein